MSQKFELSISLFLSIFLCDIRGTQYSVDTSNDFFLQGRSYEEHQQYYLAIRSFQAAHRLRPIDGRFLREARRIAKHFRGTVSITVDDGRRLLLPVILPTSKEAIRPGMPGSADDLVASFFRQHGIPIFRNDSPKCAVHVAESQAGSSRSPSSREARMCSPIFDGLM
jgi:hypothetical protein